MKREELAELLNVSRNTLSNWEKEKPELVRLINQGLAFDELIEKTKVSLAELEAIKENASNGKFKLK
ncbi:helix-turn-helix domain-containing protein [Sulfurimonas sp.]